MSYYTLNLLSRQTLELQKAAAYQNYENEKLGNILTKQWNKYRKGNNSRMKKTSNIMNK